MGVRLDFAQGKVEREFGEGNGVFDLDDDWRPVLTLSAGVKEALELAAKLAAGSQCNTSHLLLGVLQASEGRAKEALEAFGVDPKEIERGAKAMHQPESIVESSFIEGEDWVEEEDPYEKSYVPIFPKEYSMLYELTKIIFPGARGGVWTGDDVRRNVAEHGGGMGLPPLEAIFYDAYGETPLGVAARQGKADVVAALLDLGADMNRGNEKLGLTPLMWAAVEGHADVVQLLLDGGADVAQPDNQGYQAHHTTAECGRAEALQLLLQAGADVSARIGRPQGDDSGLTLLHCAAVSHKYKFRPSPHNKIMVVKLCVDAGADVNAECGGDSANLDSGSWTPLHYAARAGNSEGITALVKAGADVGAMTTVGESALHIAAAFGEPAAIHALLKAGADLEHQDCQGNTPLMTAISSGEVKATEALLSAGANPAAQDATGHTALHLLADFPDDEEHVLPGVVLASLLVNAGARVDAVNWAGRTAEEVAASKGNRVIHAVLKTQRSCG